MGEVREQWLELATENPVSFGLENGFGDLEEIHNNWIKQFILNKEDMTLQAHR